MKYNFKKIERKWQRKWEQEKVFCMGKIDVKKGAKKFYCLEMFPYASGEGLHIGHALNYTIGDIYARFKRMSGFNVFHPMGYDSFGLPAENAAIKIGKHPKKYTEDAIKNFIKQQKALGWSYDWGKMLSTHWSEYYKWNQFFFLKFLEKGLAYRKKSAANWCPKCRTVLANEQVHNGKCWRHEDTEVEIKHLEQWFLKTTDYADELLDCVDDLQWPQRIKTMQKNWIGKSYGTEIDFEVESNFKKVILVDAINAFVIKGEGIFKEMHNLLEEFSNRKIILTNANDEEIKKFDLNNMPYEIFTLKHNPEKTNPEYYKTLLKQFDLSAEDVIYFEHNKDAVKSAESVGIKTFHYDKDKKDLVSLRKFIEKIISNKKFPVFTTRPDTIYGVTFMVISAQHERLMELVTKEQKKQVENFLKKIKSVSAPRGVHQGGASTSSRPSSEGKKDSVDLEKQGVFTGSYAINPMTKEKIPVYAGNFVVADYGSGMVMGVPAHDQRDFEFAKKYGLEIKEVIRPKTNCIIVHGSPKRERKDEPPQNKKHWIVWMKTKLENHGIKTQNLLMPQPWKPNYEDWKKEFEKLEINENSILIGHSAGGAFMIRWLSEKPMKIKKLILIAPSKETTKDSQRLKEFCDFNINEKIKDFVKEIIIFISNDKKETIRSAKIYQKKLNAKLIELKNKGHFTLNGMKTNEFPELLKEIIELNQAYTGSGILINSNKFNGLDNEKAKQEITKYLIKNKLGRKSVQYKLRDWLISRQRYWGTPIPVVYCDKCGVVAVPEKDLPVILPEKVKFGKGNPLATNEKFVNVKCPKCGKSAKRETDTMDTFVDSSWYFMRYPDNKNEKSAFDKKKINSWLPVDQYVGGAEHACMHLLYSRFFTKVLRDMGFVDFDEPFIKLFNQGMLHASDGRKMSKSLGNVINPSDVVQTKGADALRLTLMSFASPDSDTAWDDKVLHGSLKFLTKVYEKFNKIKICTQGCTPNNIQKNIVTKGSKSSAKIESKLNKTIKEVTNQIENFKYNLAVIKIRDLFNSLGEEESKDVLEKSLRLLHVFCPHITEELWSKLGNKNFISMAKWPVADEKKIDEKFERQDKAIGKLVGDINDILKFIGHHRRTPKDFSKKSLQGAEKNPKIYVYVLPNEKEFYSKNLEEIKRRLSKSGRVGRPLKIFAVNDKKKYDPEDKSKKVKPGRPGIYLE